MRRMLSIVRAGEPPCVGVLRRLRSDSGSALWNVEGVTSAARLHNVSAAQARGARSVAFEPRLASARLVACCGLLGRAYKLTCRTSSRGSRGHGPH